MYANDALKCLMKTTATSKKHIFTIFFALAVIWLLLDRVTKGVLDASLSASGSVAVIPGLFKLELVHNHGAAWGIFGGATIGLALLALIVCVAIIVFLIKMGEKSGILTIVGASLVFAGGIGNMIDRIVNGYVIDFISVDFIDFPVFNVADIGVTCGIVLFLIGLMLDWREG